MSDTNYISGIVKILEIPEPRLINNDSDIVFVTFRVQLAQVQDNRIIHLVSWGKLAQDILNFYKMNDYILIEGYVSLQNTLNFGSNFLISERVEVTLLKVYPLFLSSNRFANEIDDY